MTTDATGTLTAALDQRTLQWSYTVGWESLSSAPTSVHLHGPADATAVAEMLAELNNADTELTPTSAATGTLDLTATVTPTVSGDSLRKLLNAGQVYVDVHTVNNVEGEIRGQLVRH
ncbi:CHRD domain protein [compost metagenome]